MNIRNCIKRKYLYKTLIFENLAEVKKKHQKKNKKQIQQKSF